MIDVAKALAAADPPRRVIAVPTTLSAAEMTSTHRLPAGVAQGAARVRPAVVLNDPALSASQPEPGLAASAANALGHAVEAPLTPRANPVATLAAARAAELILAGFAGPEPDRDALALGALLAGYAMDSTGYGLHHVLSQTLARARRRGARAGQRRDAAALRRGARGTRSPRRPASGRWPPAPRAWPPAPEPSGCATWASRGRPFRRSPPKPPGAPSSPTRRRPRSSRSCATSTRRRGKSGRKGATAAPDPCYCLPTRRPGGLLPLAQTSSTIEIRRAQAPPCAHVGGRA